MPFNIVQYTQYSGYMDECLVILITTEVCKDYVQCTVSILPMMHQIITIMHF